MVKVPPSISAGVIFFSRAFFESCDNSTASSTMFFLSTSRITGTSNPRSVSAATPIWMYCL